MSSRPKICWADLRSARVGVWGVGVEGRSNLGRLLAEGAEPVLVDDRPPAAEIEGLAVEATADGGLEALARCEVVIKTPGISRYRPDAVELARRGVAVTGGLGLWLEEVDPTRVACVTGTKGKSTTVALCGHLLGAWGYDAFVGGNLGRPPFEEGAGDHGLYVVETSSFQATDVATSPPVVAVTSLNPDHLDWHGDTPTYYRDKLSLATQPGADLTIVADTATLRQHEDHLGPRRHWVTGEEPALGGPWVARLGLLGPHQRADALVSRAVLQALGIEEAHDEEAMAEAAEGFGGLESRFKEVGHVGRVRFIDDSLSTNVLSARAALEALPDEQIGLIAGGFDRGIDYRPLARVLAERTTPVMVATLDRAGERIAAELARFSAGRRIKAVRCGSLEEAVRAAFDFARPQGVVLLSPAAPSFGLFRDYRERAAAFQAAMEGLRATAHPD